MDKAEKLDLADDRAYSAMQKQSKVSMKKKKDSYGRMKNIQKMKFCDNIYIAVSDFYRKNERMPESEQEIEKITKEIYQSAGLHRLVYEDSAPVVQKKLPGVIHRILKEEALKEQAKIAKKEKNPEKRAIKQRRRQNRLKKKVRKQMEEESMTVDQDDTFYYIAGYTSGGAPYGVTREEMGLEPWQKEDE